MKRALLGFGCVVSLMGCQTVRQPATESSVDQELTIQPAPPAASTPEMTQQEEPRPGFEQEPPKAQEP